jgi:hypothetical protein
VEQGKGNKKGQVKCDKKRGEKGGEKHKGVGEEGRLRSLLGAK